MKKPLKISVSIIIFILLAGVIVYIFAPQWYLIAYTKKFVIHDKIMSQEAADAYMFTRVTERTIPETSLPIKRYITENGIKIGVPFKTEPQIKEVSSGKIIHEFENGTYVFIMDKPLNILDEFTGNGKNKNDASLIFGEKAVSSNFEFLKTVFNMSPDDLTFKSSGPETVKLSTGLLLKSTNFLMPGPSPIEIVAFQNKKYKGIQFIGGEEIKSVIIQIDGMPTIRLAKMTQEEIDTIINSIEIVK